MPAFLADCVAHVAKSERVNLEGPCLQDLLSSATEGAESFLAAGRLMHEAQV